MNTQVEKDNQLVIATFKDRDNLLKSIRALFLNLGINPQEKEEVRNLSPEIKRILKDKLYPVMDKETPIGQVKDAWLGAEQMVFGHTRETIQQAIEYKNKALKMTQAALELLNEDGNEIDLTYEPSDLDPLGVNLLARNQFIRHIESQLYSLWVIANQKEESAGQKKKRIQADSSQ